jgi:hypothetical protein
LSFSEYAKLLRDFRAARSSISHLRELAAADGRKLSGLLKREGAYWWCLYELPFHEHLAVMVVLLGWEGLVLQAAKAEDPTRTAFETGV